MVLVRPAKTMDVKAIRSLVDSYAAPGQMLAKETVTLYESVQEFIVAEVDGEKKIIFEPTFEVEEKEVLESVGLLGDKPTKGLEPKTP